MKPAYQHFEGKFGGDLEMFLPSNVLVTLIQPKSANLNLLSVVLIRYR